MPKLYTPAASRLRTYQAEAAKSVATIRANHGANAETLIRTMGAADWRTAAKGRFNYTTARQAMNWESDESLAERRGSPSDRRLYCDNWPVGWRDLGDAHKLANFRETGYFADIFGEEVITGRVLQLPARGGVPQYIAGTYCDSWEGVTLWPLDACEESSDAAARAMRCAEIEAESAREHSAKSQAEQESEDLQAEITSNRTERRKLLRELKAARKLAGADSFPTMCAAIRGKVAALKERAEEAHKRIEALADNPWLVAE